MITPWEDFVIEGKAVEPLVSDLRFIGRNGDYTLTIYDGSITIDYSPKTIHVPFNVMTENEIERQGGEGGKLYSFIIQKYKEAQAKKESNYSEP